MKRSYLMNQIWNHSLF